MSEKEVDLSNWVLGYQRKPLYGEKKGSRPSISHRSQKGKTGTGGGGGTGFAGGVGGGVGGGKC